MLSVLLILSWTLSILPGMLVLMLLSDENRTRDGLALCVVLILIGPISTVGFLCWALYRTARLLLGLVYTPAAMKSNPKENASS